MPEPEPPEPYSSGGGRVPEDGGAIAATGAGGAMDLATSEGTTLEQRPSAAAGGRAPGGPEGTGPAGKPRSLWSDAWRDLRRNPVFIISGLVIVFLVVISIWPSLIASGDPLSCDLAKAQEGSQPGHPFGFDGQGCDVYTRTVYGARASVTVGVCATVGVALLGSVLGGLAGFFGGAWDAILSRITDVFFAIPVVLGGLVLLSVVTSSTVWPVIGFMVLLGWPQLSRIARGSVITAKQNDYVQAARALGASNSRMMLRHIAAQRDRAGHRRRHHRARHVHLPGGDALVPRRRPEAAHRHLGHRHLRGVAVHPQRPAHAALARRRAWRSPCSRSSCSATRCATPSTRS